MSSRQIDGHRATAALIALAGKSTPLHQQLAGICDGAERLATGTRSWRAFAPKRDALDTAIAAADGLARGLRELRSTMHRDQQETPPDAA